MPRSECSPRSSVKAVSIAAFAVFSYLSVSRCWSQDVLYPPGSGVKNVVTDYGADNTGKTSSTQAFKNAVQQNVGIYGFGVLYIPSGTYLVDEQIPYLTAGGWWGAYLTLQGQNQSNTIIKLQDNCPGFQDPTNPTAVIFTASEAGNNILGDPNYNPDGGGNQAFRNHIMNLTIDTGSGNPGAIGIDYLGNNNSRISDVSIVSDDGSGVYGLNLQRGYEGPMFIKNLTITGFATGITVSNSYGAWFEHLTLNGQSVTGINAYNGSVSIRDLKSTNSVPAVQVPGWGGVISIIDATFVGGATGTSAVQLGPSSIGTVFVRNASSQGYQSTISVNGTPVPGNSVQEWNSLAPRSLFAPAPPTSLDLPVQETPTYNDTNFSNWANVVDYGAQPNNPLQGLSTVDSYPGIQAAIDSGKTTVVLPPGNYMVSQALHVRGSVVRMVFLSAWLIPLNLSFPLNEPALQVDSTLSGSVYIEGLGVSANYWVPGPNGYQVAGFPSVDFLNNSSGTVILTNSDYIDYSNTPAASNQSVFLESVYGGFADFANETVFARNLNPETWYTNPHISVSGGSLWTLGLKIEGPNSSVISTSGNAVAEVLGFAGGVFTDVPATVPMFVNNGSTLSVTASRSNPFLEPGGSSDYDTQVLETQNGATKTLFRSLSGLSPADFVYGYGSTFSLFMDSPALASTPSVTSITTLPAPPVAGTPFTFTLNGANFGATSTVAFSGSGCASPCTVAATGNAISVSGQATLAAGTYAVSLTNGNNGSSSKSGPTFTVGNPTPTVVSISTIPAAPTGGTPFTFTLNGTNFGATSTVAFSGSGCASPCTVAATGTATSVSGQATLPAGIYHPLLTNGTTGLISAPGPTFELSNPPPSIASISTVPATPVGGTVFTFSVTGTNFGATSTLSFSGPGCANPCTAAATGTATASSGSTALPAGTYTALLTNSVTGLTSATGPTFTVGNPPPSIASISTVPATPVGGTVFTFSVTGTNFGATSTLSFSGPGCANSCTAAATGTATASSGSTALPAGTYTALLTNSATGLTSATGPTFTVGNPPPSIASISTVPATPVGGTVFTFSVTGTNFGATSTLSFSGPGCANPCTAAATGTATASSGTTALPAGTYTALLTNSVTGLTSATGPTFTVGNPPPSIASISTVPATPVGGTVFTFSVTGTNFGATSTLSFSGPGCANPCTAAATGTATASSGTTALPAGTYTALLTNSATGLTSATGPTFTVGNPPPSIASISTVPATPVGGTVFTFSVTGTNFGATSTLSFSGPGCANPCTAAATGTATASSGTTALPAGTYTALLTNSATGLTSATGPTFTVGNPPPSIASISTVPATPVGGTVFTFSVTGTNFGATSTLSFSGPGCANPCTAAATGTATASSGTTALPAGTYTALLTNSATGLTSATGPTFTVGNPPPSIASISTVPATPVGGTVFTFSLVGTNFGGKSTVSFSGPGCANPCTAAATGTATASSGSTALPAGTYTALLTNSATGLTSATGPTFTVGNPPPSIASISTVPATPVGGTAFTFSLVGTNFGGKSTVSFSGPGCANPCTAAATGTATASSGTTALPAGTYTALLTNSATGLTSATGPTFTVGNPPPSIASISTVPATPVGGTVFTFSVTGTNFGATSTLSFSGPGCANPCTAAATGTATASSGSTALPAGTYTALLTNSATGLTSATGPTFTVGNPPPTLSSIVTLPSSPVGGAPFTFSLTGTNFDPVNSTVLFSGAGCTPTPCTTVAVGTTMQVAAQIQLNAGTYIVSVENGTTQLSSSSTSTSITVSAPVQFADVASASYYASASTLLFSNKITAGCGVEPALYCPDEAITRAQLAIFVVRAVIGGDPAPGTYSTTPYFADVPQNAFGFTWIQKLSELGFTSGCGGGFYCPNDSVTRDSMAVFMARARYGSTTAFSFPSTPFFTDVAQTQADFSSIQRIREDNIVAGCGSNTYCPETVVTRGQMALFIMRSVFNQLLPPGAPIIASISQRTIVNGGSAVLTIVGLNTHFVQGITVVNNVTGLTAGATTVLSPNALTVEVSAQPGVSIPASIWVTTNSEDAILPNALAIQ